MPNQHTKRAEWLARNPGFTINLMLHLGEPRWVIKVVGPFVVDGIKYKPQVDETGHMTPGAWVRRHIFDVLPDWHPWTPSEFPEWNQEQL